MAAGLAAGIVSVSATFPIKVVTRNLQVASSRAQDVQLNGPLSCARHIFQKRGLRGFYRGLLPQLGKGWYARSLDESHGPPSLLREPSSALPYSITSWVVYDQCRKLMDFDVR